MENNGIMCIEKCPYNMKDDGILCEKPGIQRRQFISKEDVGKVAKSQENVESLKREYKLYGAGNLVKKCEMVVNGGLMDDMGPN